MAVSSIPWYIEAVSKISELPGFITTLWSFIETTLGWIAGSVLTASVILTWQSEWGLKQRRRIFGLSKNERTIEEMTYLLRTKINPSNEINSRTR